MPLGTEYRIATRFESSGDPNRDAWIIRNYRVTADAGADNPSTFADAYYDQVSNWLREAMPTNVVMNRMEVAYSGTPNTTIHTKLIDAACWWPHDQHMPDSLCGLIRLTIAGGSNRHAGKIYVPYVPAMLVSSWPALYWNRLSSIRSDHTTIFSPTGIPATIYSPVLWHRQLGASSLITGGTQLRYYGTQRRRLNSVTSKIDIYFLGSP